ncbi:hypothetical protein AGMMS50218_13660 [Actinomycetota bacterium]|nr:hypothetical protein AGMMS50218_13660 [Actinomycetota bacterium]
MGDAEKAWHPATSVVAALLLRSGCSDGARPAAISSPSPADFLTLEHGGHDVDQRPLKASFQCVFEHDLGDELIEDDAREGMRTFACHTVTRTDPFVPEPTGGTSQ